jgi:hypothetical protein
LAGQKDAVRRWTSRRTVLRAGLFGLLLLSACSPQPVQRPLEGAPVGGAASATQENSSDRQTGPPPTLAPPGPLQGGGGNDAQRPAQGVPPSPSPSPQPGIGGFVIGATDGRGANLREGPSTSGRVITTLAEGTAVEVLGEPVNVGGQSWRQIRAGGREGWVVAVVVRRR